MNTSVTMTGAMEKALKTCTTDFAQVVVKALSEKYGFDEAEALAHLELDGTKVVRKAKAAKTPKEPKAPKAKMLTPSMPLPFCGVVMDEWCKEFAQTTICSHSARWLLRKVGSIVRLVRVKQRRMRRTSRPMETFVIVRRQETLAFASR